MNNKMKTKIFWCLMLTLCFAVAALPQKQSAASFVDAFYKFQRARSGEFNAREIEAHRRWFSAELCAPRHPIIRCAQCPATLH